MSEQMEFTNTFDEFAKEYGFKDDKEIYTNGSELIPIFRVEQWLEHINKPTQMIDKSNFDEKQYRADLDSAYECGKASMLSVIEDIKADLRNNDIAPKSYENLSTVAYVRLDKVLYIIDKHIKKENK